METQTTITYEVIEPVSNKSFVTENRHETLDFYEKNYIVYEVHMTVAQPFTFTQTQVRVVLLWHGDPQKYEV
jgi:hypothetical protein